MKLTQHCYSWIVGDSNNDCFSQIRAWCLDRDSNPVLLKFTNYSASCYVELPTTIDGKAFDWCPSDVDILMNSLERVLTKYDKHHPIGYRLVQKEKLYFYKGGRKDPHLYLEFWNQRDMKEAVSWLTRGIWPGRDISPNKTKFPTRHDNIDMIRKLLTDQNLHYSAWFTVNGKLTPEKEKISTLEREYDCDWKSIAEINKDICEMWLSSPGFLSFDIETYSSNPRKFPDKYKAQDKAYMLSCVYERYGQPKTLKKYGILIGDCGVNESNAGVNTYFVNNEVELCRKFEEIIIETDPEVITGYNIFGFDWPYLNHRLRRLAHKWNNFSRLSNAKQVMSHKSWSSAAYGNQDLTYPKCEGRINLDMLSVIKFDHKLLMYKLSFVAKHFLGDKKEDNKFEYTAQDMFKTYKDFMEVADINEFDESFESNKRLLNIDFDFDFNDKVESESDYFDENAVDKDTAYQRMRDLFDYCMQDSDVVNKLLPRLSIWPFLVASSSIVDVSLESLYTAGQQHRCVSLIYNVATKAGYILDKGPQPDREFMGGYVNCENPGIKENVAILDFSALYPSIIRSENICFTTWIPQEDWDKVPIEDCRVISYDQVEHDKVVGVSKMTEEEKSGLVRLKNDDGTRYWTKEVTRHHEERMYNKSAGVLPNILTDLLAERNAVRAKINKNNEPEINAIFNARQLGLKVTMNSVYGLLGIKNNAKLPALDLAMAITAKGREHIKRCARICEEKAGLNAVYADTDSQFIELGVSSELASEKGLELDQMFNGAKIGDRIPFSDKLHKKNVEGIYNDGIMVFELESIMRSIIFLTKKRYAAIQQFNGVVPLKPILDEFGKTIGHEDPDLYVKGITLARRDNANFVRMLYKQALVGILTGKGFLDVFNMIVNHVAKLLDNDFELEDFLVVKGLSAKYKSDSSVMNVFGKRLRADGILVTGGDRLRYLVEDNGKEKLGLKMILEDEFVNRDDDITVDKSYYMLALAKPVNQLFSIAYPKEVKKLQILGVKRTPRCNPVSLDKVVEYVYYMMTVNNYSKESIVRVVEDELKAISRRRYVIID